MSSKRTLLQFEEGSISSPSKRIKIQDGTSIPDGETRIKTEEPLNPTQIDHSAKNVSLCALLTSVSPMKNKRFVGELIDEKASISMVGFDPSNQVKLEKLCKQKVPILISKCDVRYNNYSNTLEVVVKSYSTIETSQKHFEHKGSRSDWLYFNHNVAT